MFNFNKKGAATGRPRGGRRNKKGADLSDKENDQVSSGNEVSPNNSSPPKKEMNKNESGRKNQRKRIKVLFNQKKEKEDSISTEEATKIMSDMKFTDVSGCDDGEYSGEQKMTISDMMKDENISSIKQNPVNTKIECSNASFEKLT